MKPQIGFAGNIDTMNVLDDINLAVKHEFDWFELSLHWKQNLELKDDVVRKLRETAEAHGIKLSAHAAYYLPTSTMLKEVREGVFRYMENVMTMAENAGIDRVTIHPGYAELSGKALAHSYESMVYNLKEIVSIAREHGVTVCLENTDNNEIFLCTSMDAYIRALKSVKGLKATLDVGHANVTGTPPHEYFGAVKDFVMNVHVHDNNGETDEHLPPGKGSIDFHTFLGECKKAGYSGPFILEMFRKRDNPVARKILMDLWDKA